MVKTINQVWGWLNGKKQASGLFLGVVYYGALQMSLIQPNQSVENLIATLVGVGALHKLIKR